MTNLVFVYGTLQSGQRNNKYLTDNGARLVGRAVTVHPYVMLGQGVPFVLPRWPRGKLDTMAGRIVGEVWACDDAALAACDRLEGHPGFYERKQVLVNVPADGQALTAWLYFMPSVISDFVNVPNEQGLVAWSRS